jgi:hypothetical protein
MIMVSEFCRVETAKGPVVEKRTQRPWAIPAQGRCVIDMLFECDIPSSLDIGHDSGLENALQAIREAKTEDQKDVIFLNVTSSPYFFFNAHQVSLLLFYASFYKFPSNLIVLICNRLFYLKHVIHTVYYQYPHRVSSY